MRVIRSAIARVRHEEQGAVLFIVAVSLLTFVGMLVLTVDLGRGVAYRRQMVNGTDAAALAAAQQCALGNGTLAAQDAATAVFLQNVSLRPAEITSIVMPECENPAGTEPKTVTVTTRADISYFFAPIFGVETGDVATSSTAIWAAGRINPVPIMIDQEQLDACQIPWNEPPDEDQPPRECDLDYDKDTLGEPAWGTLGLPWWGERDAWLDPQKCSIDANTLKDIIAAGGYDAPLDLTPPGDGSQPTYTCVENGLSDSVWAELENGTFIFPVIDIDTSEGYIVPPNSIPNPPSARYCTGATVLPSNKDCKIHTVNVVGWVLLHVTDTGNHGSTITVETVTETTTGGWVGQGHVDIGIRQVRLVD
jgi:Flp pilus assembly protein TadG